LPALADTKVNHMLLVIGFIIVLGATLGGFMIAGGQPVVLLHVSEFVTIGGIALGILVISSPAATLKHTLSKIIGAITGAISRKQDYSDLLKLLYESFMLARRDGIVALEDHVGDPKKSTIFQKYPSFLNNHERCEFFTQGLKPLIDGRIKPEQVAELMEQELDAKEEEASACVHVLQLCGDSLPGVGIVAAVLGIINTMAAIADGPEVVGEKVAAALTGTFLGILFAYGFINPITARVKHNNHIEMNYFRGILKGLAAFAAGTAPIMAVEMARRALEPSVQPGADELEASLKLVAIAK
jgi:chemotaxis protein MotA